MMEIVKDDLKITLKYVSRGEYVPDVEKKIEQLKKDTERTNTEYHSRTYQKL